MYFLKYFMAVIEYPMSKQGPRNDFYQNKILKKQCATDTVSVSVSADISVSVSLSADTDFYIGR